MGRKKLIRFAALDAMENVVDWRYGTPGWLHGLFGSERPLTLELGCGRGEYTLALARSRPDQAVLGVDRNGSRLWKGAERALEEKLANAFFLRAQAEDLEEHLPAGRISEIWLPFPDPLPKKRQAKHRLVSPPFLARYRRLLAPGGVVHLKTDDADLMDFAEHGVCAIGGRRADLDDALSVQTTYERRFRAEGRPIHQRTFRLG